MINRLLHLEFPEGVKTIYINGKLYTREEFYKAQLLERRRGSKGRFVSGVSTSKIKFPKKHIKQENL